MTPHGTFRGSAAESPQRKYLVFLFRQRRGIHPSRRNPLPTLPGCSTLMHTLMHVQPRTPSRSVCARVFHISITTPPIIRSNSAPPPPPPPLTQHRRSSFWFMHSSAVPSSCAVNVELYRSPPSPTEKWRAIFHLPVHPRMLHTYTD